MQNEIMHPVKVYFDQQYGYVRNRSYQPFLSRLRCLKKDDFSQIYPTQESYPDTPIFACKFSDKVGYENLLALANEDGKIAVHDVQSEKERSGLHAHNNAIFDLTWLFQQLKIVTASGDHSSKLYDVSNLGITEERTFFRHERSVKSIASSKDDPSVFATGGRDGNIILWDIRADNSDAAVIGKSDKIIHKSHVSKVSTPTRTRKSIPLASQNNSVTGLVFQDCKTLISCGAGDGCIKIWDLRKTHYNGKREPLPKFTLPYSGKSAKNGFSHLILDADSQKLFANCLDNNIYCYNMRTYNENPVMTYTGHQNNTFYIKSALSNDGFLISGSSDENAYIWNLKYSEPVCKLVGHTAEVTCVAWCRNYATCIVTCSDDIRHKLWRIGPEDVPEDFEFDGRGRTEVLPLYDKCTRKKLKRLISNPEIFNQIPKKFINSCDRCLSSTTNARFCENCNYTDKRKSFDDYKSSKRVHFDFEPRRLFAHSNVVECPKDNPNKRKLQEVDFSPLKDLPNFVIDGVAPHLNFSPPKKKHCDWLTRMRIDHNFKKKMLEKCEEPSLKVSKLEITPKSKKFNKNSSQKSPLLKYFKLKTNSLKIDKHPVLSKNCYTCDSLNSIDKMQK